MSGYLLRQLALDLSYLILLCFLEAISPAHYSWQRREKERKTSMFGIAPLERCAISGHRARQSSCNRGISGGGVSGRGGIVGSGRRWKNNLRSLAASPKRKMLALSRRFVDRLRRSKGAATLRAYRCVCWNVSSLLALLALKWHSAIC